MRFLSAVQTFCRRIIEVLGLVQLFRWAERFLGWGEHVEFIANRIRELGQVGTVIDSVLTPPPAIGLGILAVGLALIALDVRKWSGAPTITFDRSQAKPAALIFLFICVPLFAIAWFGRTAPEPRPPRFFNGPLQSTWEKMLFACDVPPPDIKEEANWPRQKAIFTNGFIAWAESIGLSATVTDVTNGLRMEIEAKTPEGKQRILSVTGGFAIDKIAFEIRRVGQWEVISFISSLSGALKLMYLFPPSPESSSGITMRKNVERIFGIPDGKCQMF